MDVSRIGFIGSMQYKPPVAQTTGVNPSQRLEQLQKTEKTLTEKYGPGAIDETSAPVAREQSIYGLNPFAKPVDSNFKIKPGALSEKYGTASISFTGNENIKTNFMNGLSPLKTGALGEEAIHVKNGRAGGSLNIIS